MKKLFSIFIVAASINLPATVGLAVSDNNNTAEKLDGQRGVQYQELKTNTNSFFGAVHKHLSVPNFLYGKPLFKSHDPSENYEQIINNFFQAYPDLFQISINDFKVEVEKPKDRTITLVHLFQQHKNIPVFGAELILTFNDTKELISYTGKYIPDINTVVEPKASKEEIQNIVATDLQVGAINQQPKLFLFNKGILTDTQEPTRLAWRLGTNGWVYFIDANTKEVLYKYNDEHHALTRGVYTASGGIPTLPGTLVINEGDDISTVTDDDAVEAYIYSGHVYSYFNNNFGVDSFDNLGSSMITTVDYDFVSHPDFGAPNAMWCNSNKETDQSYCPDTSQTIFYDGYTVFDILAHEWTHAIDDYSVGDAANGLYGLTYSEESGALNESYSDIFAVLIEAEYGDGLDWNIGEDLLTGVLRNLENPTLYSQPDHISNQCTAANDYCNYNLDSGGVHTNSGIPNKAAYLIMSDLGLEKAENIFYYTLRDQLTVSATFEDNYNALLATCLTLDVAEVSPTDCDSIYNAYNTVGITEATYLYVDIQATSTAGYAPLAVAFDGAASQSFGGTITDYVWDLDSTVDSDGNGSQVDDVDDTDTIASSIYDDPKTLNVRLTITDNTGNFAHQTMPITVNDPLDPSFTISGDGLPAPATVTFDASGTVVYFGVITDYSWNFGDSITTSGTSATANHAYASDGYYTVTLTVTTDTGYSETYSHMVWVGSGNPEVSGPISNDTWSASDGTYIIDAPITIADGATLTINPGTIVKLQSSSYINANGSLVLAGTAANPVILTSYKDDTYGGDTNGDGGATTPAAEDWRYIKFNPGSSGTISHTLIQYGGYEGTGIDYPMLDIQSSNVAISNSTIGHNGYHTVRISNVSPIISDSVIEYAQANHKGIYIDNASPTLSGNTIRYNYTGIYATNNSAPIIDGNFFTDDFIYGIDLAGSAMNSIITNNTFTDITKAIYLNDPADSLTMAGNISSSTDWSGIVLDGQMNGNFALTANDLVYVIQNLDVSSGDTLTIDPGTIVKFLSTSSDLDVVGTLHAVGTAEAPIVFTSLDDDSYGGDTDTDDAASPPDEGDWRQLLFEPSSNAQLSHTIVRYGGRTSYPMLEIASNNVTIDHATISNSQTTTVEINNSNPTISQSTLTGSTQLYESSAILSGNTFSYPYNTALYIGYGSPTVSDNSFLDSQVGLSLNSTYAATPTVTNNTFTGNSTPLAINGLNGNVVLSGNSGSSNTYNGIHLIGSTTGDVTLGQDNELPYMLSSLTVISGNTLTIEPGLVLKFPFTFSTFTINGSLQAVGTSEEPIVLTSYRDDSYGGDTNEDGNATVPAAGDWRQVYFGTDSQATLEHVVVQYGGDYDSYAMVDVNSTNVAIAGSTLAHSQDQALRVTNANPTITTTEISGSRNGIYTVGSNPIFTNNIITNNTNYGFYNASTITVTAENNAWGDPSGPYHATTNPTGIGDQVSNYVDYTPWLGMEPTAVDTTPPADVALGYIRKDVWARSITLNWTNPTDADLDHLQIDRTDIATATTTTFLQPATSRRFTDTTPAYNITYTYTVRACDTSGNCSPGQTTTNQRLRTPTPSGLILTSADSSLLATWNPSSAPASTVGGYRVYYGTSATALTTIVDVGNVTSTTLTGLTNGTRYFVAVSAYNTAGLESPQSQTRARRPQPL